MCNSDKDNARNTESNDSYKALMLPTVKTISTRNIVRD